MTPELSKSIAGLIVSIMTFLGWNVSDYISILSPEVAHNVENVATSSSESPKKDLVTKATTTVTSIPNQTVTKPIQKTPPKKQPPATPTTKTNTPSTVVTPPPPVTQTPIVAPTYYPSPIEIKDVIKNEISNIVTVINPPQTPAEITKEKQNLSTEDKILNSVVNIYCAQTIGNQIRKTTGTGVMIDPNGVILTNAHVAEYFLLAENGNNTNCFIRTNSPAISSYKAKLVYLPENWIKNNAGNITRETLTGTGKDDYALLTITERVRATAPNVPLPYLTISDSSVNSGDSVNVAGYPAGFSDVKILDSGLYALVKPTSIARTWGLGGGNSDVLLTSSTPVAEHGSSGGAVTDTDGNLKALIFAISIDPAGTGNNIQAISLPYIERSIKSYTGKTLQNLIDKAQDEAKSFEKNSVPSLTSTLLN